MHRCDENHLPEINPPCRPVQKKLSEQDAGLRNPRGPTNPDRKCPRYLLSRCYFLYSGAAIRWYPMYQCSRPQLLSGPDEPGVDVFPYDPGFYVFLLCPGKQKYIHPVPGCKNENQVPGLMPYYLPADYHLHRTVSVQVKKDMKLTGLQASGPRC